MIPNIKERELDTQGVTASTVFGISVNDTAHILSILRDTIYTDKPMAVLREYSANAWDAHRDAGKADVPIKVTIPTDLDPTLRIQDFGKGLSHQDVFEVFTQYGASTKRNSDNSVGMLGIGSKSGFAYSDSFTIISCHGGKRRTYVAALDSSDKGVLNFFDEQDCGDATGITIEIAVRKNDILEFVSKAKDLYKFFNPRPDINVDIPDITGSQFDLKNGRIDEKSNEDHWTAVMGCVPYRINTDQLYEGGDRMVGNYVDEIKGVLYFSIGEVQVNASREELRYSDITKKTIAAKFAALMDEYVESTIQNLEAGSFSPWQKRMRAKMLDQLELPLPESMIDLCKEWVELPKHTKFQLSRGSSTHPIVRLPLEADLRILVRDDSCKSLAGYDYQSNDFVIRATEGVPYEEMKKELEDCLEKAKLHGVPVLPLGYLAWTKPWSESQEEEKKQKKEERKAARAAARLGKKANNKYWSRVFRLKLDAVFKHPYSQMWEVVSDYEPKKKDLYVVFESFRLQNNHLATSRKLETDLLFCKLFDIEMPIVYGYKSTEKSPIDVKDIIGTPYGNPWREKFFEKVSAEPTMAKIIHDLDLVNAWPITYDYDMVIIRVVSDKHHLDRMEPTVKKAVSRLISTLGKRHPITKWAEDTYKAVTRYKSLTTPQRQALDELIGRIRPRTYVSHAEELRQSFYKLYPMLSPPNTRLSSLWDNSGNPECVKYVKDMDTLRRTRSKKFRL